MFCVVLVCLSLGLWSCRKPGFVQHDENSDCSAQEELVTSAQLPLITDQVSLEKQIRFSAPEGVSARAA